LNKQTKQTKIMKKSQTMVWWKRDFWQEPDKKRPGMAACIIGRAKN